MAGAIFVIGQIYIWLSDPYANSIIQPTRANTRGEWGSAALRAWVYRVLGVLGDTSVKVSWARPPVGEYKEFPFGIIQMTESIAEWTIHGYD